MRRLTSTHTRSETLRSSRAAKRPRSMNSRSVKQTFTQLIRLESATPTVRKEPPPLRAGAIGVESPGRTAGPVRAGRGRANAVHRPPRPMWIRISRDPRERSLACSQTTTEKSVFVLRTLCALSDRRGEMGGVKLSGGRVWQPNVFGTSKCGRRDFTGPASRRARNIPAAGRSAASRGS
jgi:hypothetical protein